jgi:DNA primase
LRGLFNRRIDGDGKFLLGERTVFSLDWERLAQARSVFVCEGIIDYLSLKTLEGADAVGVALLGGHVDGELRGLLPESELIAAFDDDEAGRKAGERLRTLFPDRVVKDYDLLGHHDPNELLTAGGRGGETSKGSHKLTPELRARIAFDSRPSREIAAELGLHHSTVCEIREDAQRILRDTWSRRRPGPKPAPPEDGRMAAARDEADALREKVDLGRMRNDWLELQLKWHRRREEEERRRGATQKKTTEKRRPQAKRRKKKRRK